MNHNLYLSSFVRRWHTDPKLSATGQTLGHHQWGVTMLILALNPAPSRDLLTAAMTHDAGEFLTGDMPWAFKTLYGGGGLIEAVEQAGEAERDDMLGIAPGALVLTSEDEAWLAMADALEAWLFVALHNRARLGEETWQRSRERIEGQAFALGVAGPVVALMQEALS